MTKAFLLIFYLQVGLAVLTLVYYDISVIVIVHIVYNIFDTVLGEYVLNICSKLVAVESVFILVSRSTAYMGCILAMTVTTSSVTSWSKQTAALCYGDCLRTYGRASTEQALGISCQCRFLTFILSFPIFS